MLRQLSGSLKYKRSVKFSGFKGIMSGYFKTNSSDQLRASSRGKTEGTSVIHIDWV